MRLCKCGCGKQVSGRPDKKYFDRWHKDRARQRRRRQASRKLRHLWESIGREEGWL